MLAPLRPIWDGNETWLVVTGVILWGAFPVVYAGSYQPFIFHCLSCWRG